jgi:hypothetical protein
MKLFHSLVRNTGCEFLFLVLIGTGVGAILAGCSKSSTGSAAAETTPAAGSQEPWTAAQLIQPAELAKILSDPAAEKPYVLDIGTPSLVRGGKIANSIVIGPGYDPKNLEKLRASVSMYPKDADVVIYCGCCPFRDCPNIRPAFRVLQEMKFTRAKLLNIPTTLKADWINKGYPSEK